MTSAACRKGKGDEPEQLRIVKATGKVQTSHVVVNTSTMLKPVT